MVAVEGEEESETGGGSIGSGPNVGDVSKQNLVAEESLGSDQSTDETSE